MALVSRFVTQIQPRGNKSEVEDLEYISFHFTSILLVLVSPKRLFDFSSYKQIA